VLSVSRVYKTFNIGTVNEKTALKNICLHLTKGDFVTLIGGNGSGKSTLLNCIAGVHDVDDGSITIDGVDVTKIPEHKRAGILGRVFQDPMVGTAANMGIEENLALAYRRGKKRTFKWGISSKERELYKEMLSQLDLGLENRLSDKVGLLSGGQRQALTLLMATLNKPKLLLLDEHTAALDPKTAAKVLKLSDHFITEGSLTTLMVTHNMRDAIKYGNRLIMMHEGRILLDIKDEAKQKLTVEDLLQRFGRASGEEFTSDRALLA
jgi:putative ABC transport system ATP-binding protein